jgi:hypothetical protein
MLAIIEWEKAIPARKQEESQSSAVGNDQAQVEAMLKRFGPRGESHVSSKESLGEHVQGNIYQAYWGEIKCTFLAFCLFPYLEAMNLRSTILAAIAKLGIVFRAICKEGHAICMIGYPFLKRLRAAKFS